jgi:hypothetical protein
VLIGYIKELKLATPIWGRHALITEMVDRDYLKGDISQFIQMLQDHMLYNMSDVTSVEVWGISDLEALAEILYPVSGNTIGYLSLWKTLMKYLKLQDDTLMCAEVHQ